MAEGKTDLSGLAFFAKLGLVALTVSLVAGAVPNEPPKPKGPPSPKKDEFASSDPKVLATNAMLQMARELQALDQVNSARVYVDESANPPPGTAARALEHISDEFLAAGDVALAAKLRNVAKQIYTPAPVPAPAT